MSMTRTLNLNALEVNIVLISRTFQGIRLLKAVAIVNYSTNPQLQKAEHILICAEFEYCFG